MWVIFLLSAMGFAIAALLVAYVGNKILNKIQSDNEKSEVDKIKLKENNKNE